MVELIVNNVLEIIAAVISCIVAYYIIPAIKTDLIPWLKDKRIYNMAKKFVQGVEKLYESGVIEKVDKKSEVIRLLEEQGIIVDDKLSMFIESAVKEVDLINKAIRDEIKNSEVIDEVTDQ